MIDLNALMGEREKIVVAQRALNDKVLAEKRAYTAEENEQYEKLDAEFDRLDKEIKTAENEEQRKAKLAEREAMLKEKPAPKAKPEPEPERRVVSGRAIYATPEYHQAFVRHLQKMMLGANELRALQADQDTVGGYVVAPEQFINELIKYKDDLVFVRQYARKFNVGRATSLGAPALENDPADPTWTTEIKVGSEDSTMSFEKRHLTPHPVGKYIKVSNELIRVSMQNIEALVRERLGYKFAIVEENAFLNGSGANRPLGVFTAISSGISTSRDVSTGNTASEIKADNLIECVYALKAQYRRNCRWLFGRTALKQIRKLKDGDGNYLWQSGLQTNRPGTILDFAYDESEYCPATFTTGLYVGILADWSSYWIADSFDMSIQVVDQLYAATNQTAYFGRQQVDAMPVDENAFVRVKLG